MGQPVLRPQDVVVLAKLLTYKSRRPPLAQVAVDLAISASEIHAALKRLARAGLVSSADVPIRQAAEEFLIHAVKYVFPAVRGEVTRGLPTSYAAAPLNREIVGSSELPPVWPFAKGTHRGVTFEPLYRTAPSAALKDPSLYELLALLDGVRGGRARERRLAETELVRRVRRAYG